MRTRRYFQPSLDGMPARIAPSSVAFHAAAVSTVGVPSGATFHAVAASNGDAGMCPSDSSDPSNTANGDGADPITAGTPTMPPTLVA